MSKQRLSTRELLQQLAVADRLTTPESADLQLQDALLDVAALPRAFNIDIVRDVLLPSARSLAPGAGDASLDWLMEHGDVEPVPGSAGLYRMRSRPRTERLREWTLLLSAETVQPRASTTASRTETLIGVSQSLADVFRAWGSAWTLERLFQLIAADPAQANTEILEAYHSADNPFDSVRCYEILTVLKERDALLTQQLLATRAYLRRYYDARTRWTDAYTGSSQVLERDSMREAFDWVRSQTPEWIGVLEARGGLGKSMLVRWLIARKCVPEPTRIPCARVDFDFALPTLLAEYPWLIIPQLVDQLEIQLPSIGEHGLKTELQTLAEQVDEQLRIAYESQNATQGAGYALAPDRSRRFGAQMAERLGRALNERAKGGPVVIVFDTIEEAFLRPEFYSRDRRNVLEGVLELLRAVHGAHPALKVIFAGRFSPAGPEAKGEFTTQYQGNWRPITLVPFLDPEAHTYLTTVRKLTDDKRVTSIVRRSGGLPLVLALWADIVLSRSNISAAEIDESPEADLAYLIERVLDRLRNPKLHWVIRYGVIPRRLTRDFFDEVMIPFMHAAMKGRALHDDPARDRIAAVRGGGRFRTDLLADDEAIDPDTLWSELSQYVSGSSFVYRSPDDHAAIVFHTEVVEPMRRVLREDQRDTYIALHARAVRHFDERARGAESIPARTAALREAVYHLLQASPPDATATFERWVNEASASGDAVFGTVLIEELLSSEIALGDTAVSPIAPALVSIAHTMRLNALVTEAQKATGQERATRWVAVSQAADEFRRFSSGNPAFAPRDGFFQIVEAESAFNIQGARAALPLYEKALEAAQTEPLRLSASLGAADAADRLGESDATTRHLRTAWGLWQKAGDEDHGQRRRRDLARVMESQADFAGVIAVLHGSSDTGESDASAPTVRLVEACLTSGRLREALRYAKSYLLPPGAVDEYETDFADRFARAHAMYGIALATFGAEAEARKVVETRLSAIRKYAGGKTSPDSGRGPGLRASAVASVATARIYDVLIDSNAALEAAEQGQREWAMVGNAEGAGDALRRRAEICLYVGDRRLAGSVLGESTRLTLPVESEVRGRLLLLSAMHRYATSPGPLVRQSMRALLDDVAVRRWRALRILVLGALLEVDPESHATTIEALERDLASVDPVGARLEILRTLARYLERPLTLTTLHAERLARAGGVSDPPKSGDAAEDDRTSLSVAQADWLLGRSAASMVRLEALLARIPHGVRAVEALELARRLAAEERFVSWSSWRDRFPRRNDAGTVVNGRVALSLGEIALRLGDVARAEALSSEAGRDLAGGETTPTRWTVYAHVLAAGVARAQRDIDAAQAHLLKADSALLSLGQDAVGHPGSLAVIPMAPVDDRVTEPFGLNVLDSMEMTPDEPGSEDGAVRLVTISTAWRDGLVVGASVGAAPPRGSLPAEVGPLCDLIDPRRIEEVVPFELVVRVADEWRELAAELTHTVFEHPSIAALANEKQRADVQLMLEPATLAALPVELVPWKTGDEVPLYAAPGTRCVYRGTPDSHGDVTSWVQKALADVGHSTVADGVWGPPSRDALANFQKSERLPSTGAVDRDTLARLAKRLTHGRPPEPVALIVGAREGSRRHVRSARTTVMKLFDATELYHRAGFRVVPAMGDLAGTLQQYRPPVLHLQGTFDEVSGLGGVVMTTRGERSDEAPDTTQAPSTLGHLLRGLPRLYRPIVVLDPPAATSRTEIVRQLLLRNVFAHELFRLDCCPAVIAVGFEDPTPDKAPRAYTVLSDGWKRRKSVTDVLRLLRKRSVAEMVRLLPRIPGRKARVAADLVAFLLEFPSASAIAYAHTPSSTFLVRPSAKDQPSRNA